MARIRSRGNRATELRFIWLLRSFRIKGWRRGSKLPGRPDFVFLGSRVAVFVDGDFWHGNPRGFRLPKSNVDYWAKKIQGNRLRDETVNRSLETLGWRVVRFWQSSLHDGAAVMEQLSRILAGQDDSQHGDSQATGEDSYPQMLQQRLVVAEPRPRKYATRRKRRGSAGRSKQAVRCVPSEPPRD